MPSLHFDSAREKAHKDIGWYCKVRDKLWLTKNPELAHDTALRLLWILDHTPVVGGVGEHIIRKMCHNPALEKVLWDTKFQLGNLDISYPVGVAAGMFKDVRTMPWWLFQEGGLQVWFVTLGGITQTSQPGNPKPRNFSFPEVGAGINRYWLNNIGLFETKEALQKARRKWLIPKHLPVLVNLCNGHDITDSYRAAEFETQAMSLCDVVDGFEINISCPNQIGAQDLAKKMDILRDSLRRVHAVAGGKPIFLKISPDTDREALVQIIEASREYVTGYSSTNTTVDPDIRSRILHASGKWHLLGSTPDKDTNHGDFTLLNGGISGAPLLQKQLAMTQLIRKLAPDKYIIGIGGITDEESAAKTITAWANSVAMLTAFAQKGHGVIALANLWVMEALRNKGKK